MVESLPNYLRAYRKRRGFSQEEVAHLLGCRHGTKISRYERFGRTPLLETALAYEVIFRVPVRELFLGIFEAAERETRKRARYLARQIERHHGSRLVEQKLTALRALTAPPPGDLSIHPLGEL